MPTPNNLYRMTTATSIPNSGTGSNVLTKPAGTEVASIVPGKKYSVFIPSEATFTTNFNLTPEGYTIYMYTKPEPGVVLSVDGNVVTFTGHSYVLSNPRGESVEISVRSNAARLVIFTYSNMEASLSVDGISGDIPADVTSASGQLSVSLLAGGGIVDNVTALRGLLTSNQINKMVEDYLRVIDQTPETVKMFDDNRDFVQHRVVLESHTLEPGGYHSLGLRSNDANSFKVEYNISGDVQVFVNEVPWESGMSLDGVPDRIDLYSEFGGRVENLTISEYYDDELLAGAVARFVTDLSSGTPAPTHRHDDSAANHGDTDVDIDLTARTVSGWFYATDGAVLPGVSMSDGVLTGTGLYVNGKPYSGGVVRDWYFLTRVADVSADFTIEVPVHALTLTGRALTAGEIDDLYESFFGNPVFTAQEEHLPMSDEAGFVISTEWNIVASG